MRFPRIPREEAVNGLVMVGGTLLLIGGLTHLLGCDERRGVYETSSSSSHSGDVSIKVETINHNTYIPAPKASYYFLPYPLVVGQKKSATLAECPSVAPPNSTCSSSAQAPFGSPAKN